MRKISFLFLALLFTPLMSAQAMSSASILSMINAERAKAGLSAVRENAKLDQAAQLKADDMAARGYFEHIGPDGKDPWSWFAIVGYDWSWAGEILAMNANTESETAIVEAWMNSPEHKKIIMDARYTEVGFGIAAGTYQGQRVAFVAGEFGLPKTTVVAPAPAPIPAQTPVAQTHVATPLQAAVKTVTKAAAKPVEAVVKKAEAKVMAQATTTASVESASSTALKTVEHPIIAKASLLTRLRLFFSRLFTFSSRRVG